MSDALFADLALCAVGSVLCWTAVHAVEDVAMVLGTVGLLLPCVIHLWVVGDRAASRAV